jgi:hypothetical protein
MLRESTAMTHELQQPAGSSANRLRLVGQQLTQFVLVLLSTSALVISQAAAQAPALPPGQEPVKLVQGVCIQCPQDASMRGALDLAQFEPKTFCNGVEFGTSGQPLRVMRGQPDQPERTGDAEKPPRWFVQWEQFHWWSVQLPVILLGAFVATLAVIGLLS